MTSVIRVADVGFYGTHILFGGKRTHTGDLTIIINKMFSFTALLSIVMSQNLFLPMGSKDPHRPEQNY